MLKVKERSKKAFKFKDHICRVIKIMDDLNCINVLTMHVNNTLQIRKSCRNNT